VNAVPELPPLRMLIVDDDDAIRRFLRMALTARGHTVQEARTLAEARLACTARPPDAVLLDLGLPDGDGVALVHEVRGWSALPILVLSARGQESVKVQALDAGADDFLTKPFGVPELLARLRVALRHRQRTGAGAAAVFECRSPDGQGFRFDAQRHVCHRLTGDGAVEVRLTPTEFHLLGVLVHDAGKVLTHTFLLRAVWGPQHDGDLAYLRVYMGQLRQKLEPVPADPRWLLTEPGVGYRLQPDEG
jgi:two-component system KDP operon response regulator KdpE